MTLKQYCNHEGRRELLKEWDFTKNTEVTPQTVSAFSAKRVWWKCRIGHEWQAEIRDRSNKNRSCPYCAGRLPVPGETDLATLKPEIAKEWHTEKNGNLYPGQFTVGSERKVWWKCKLGHEWQCKIENRTVKGYGCPYCAGSKAWPGFNDLETLHPRLMRQWHPTLNRGVDPSRLRPGSEKRVYWVCEEGHVWDTVVYQRTGKNPSGCPYCSGRLKGSAKAVKINLEAARKEAEAKEERKRDLRRRRIEEARMADG